MERILCFERSASASCADVGKFVLDACDEIVCVGRPEIQACKAKVSTASLRYQHVYPMPSSRQEADQRESAF